MRFIFHLCGMISFHILYALNPSSLLQDLQILYQQNFNFDHVFSVRCCFGISVCYWLELHNRWSVVSGFYVSTKTYWGEEAGYWGFF